MVKTVFSIICPPLILYGLEDNLFLKSDTKIPIENIYYCNLSCPSIFPLKLTNHYPKKRYGWNDLSNFSDGTKKVHRSLFFNLCTVFNISCYEPKVGYAFLQEDTVCLIEKPTCKHIADLIQVCAIGMLDDQESSFLKDQIINLLLVSYSVQKLTRPSDSMGGMHKDSSTQMLHALRECIIPINNELIDTSAYKKVFKKLYNNAKYGYKRSFYLYVVLAIGLLCINRLGELNNYNLYGLVFPLVYGVFSAIYFYNKLDSAYDNLQKTISNFDVFAQQYNAKIQKEINIKKQQINCEQRFLDKQNCFISNTRNDEPSIKDEMSSDFYELQDIREDT